MHEILSSFPVALYCRLRCPEALPFVYPSSRPLNGHQTRRIQACACQNSAGSDPAEQLVKQAEREPLHGEGWNKDAYEMMDESNEAKLLKLLIGYVHVMTVNNLAVLRHKKSFVELTEAEKGSLNAEVSGGAVGVAAQINAIVATPKGETPPVVN